jgi:hypothetical protein
MPAGRSATTPAAAVDFTRPSLENDEVLRSHVESAHTPAEFFRGLDDKIRVSTAKFLAQNPDLLSNWNTLRTASLKKKYEAIQSDDDCIEFLLSLYAKAPFWHSIGETHLYSLVPPAAPLRKQLKQILALGVSNTTARKFIDGGFVYGRVPRHGRSGLVDTDYGIGLRKEKGRIINTPLDVSLLRYAARYPHTASTPQDILDLGAIRRLETLGRGASIDSAAIQCLSLDLKCVEIETREQLNGILQKLRNDVESKCIYQMWFRGQPAEYCLGDFMSEAREGLCPWRSAKDASLVPSLYRTFAKKQDSLKSYCEHALELTRYYYFIKELLGTPDFTRDQDAATAMQLGPQWPTSLEVELEVRDVSGSLIETGITRQAFRGLQAALYFQHYGLGSGLLDITYDIDVALFFAQREAAPNGYRPVDFTAARPVIYVFLLDPDVDLFLNTSHLLQGDEVLRPKRQKCGILAGATLLAKNYYARFVAPKLVLAKEIEMECSDPEHYFPGPAEDRFLNSLLAFSDLQRMRHSKPFHISS